MIGKTIILSIRIQKGINKVTNETGKTDQCPYRNRGKSQGKNFLDSHGVRNFIEKDRERTLKALEDYFKNYRRGFLIVCGERGHGKTKLVRKALDEEKIIMRDTSAIEERQRRVLGIWSDLSVSSPLFITGKSIKNSDSNGGKQNLLNINSPIPNDDGQQLEVQEAKFICKSILISIIQAIVNYLSPHTNYYEHGESLRNKMGTTLYYNISPNRIPRIMAIKFYRIRKLLFFLYGWGIDLLIAIMLIILIIINLFFALKFQILPEYIDFYFSDSFGNLIVVIFVSIFISVSFYAILHKQKWRYIQKHAKRLRQIAYASNYFRREETQDESSTTVDTGFIKNIVKPLGTVLKWDKSHKWQEMAEFTRDVPNLLKELRTYIFHLNMVGIAPVLVIDGLDNIGANEGFIRSLHQQENIWRYDRWLQELEAWKTNHQLIICIDSLCRLKSLGSFLSVILIGDMSMARLLEHSANSNGPYHTLFKEQILLGPVSWRAWDQAIRKFNENCPPDCVHDKQKNEYCTDMKFCDKGISVICKTKQKRANQEIKAGVCLCVDSDFDCVSFKYWSVLIWIEGKGQWAEMLTRLHSYRQQEWPLSTVLKDMRWCSKVADLMDQMEKDGKYIGWLPGNVCRNVIDADIQTEVMTVLNALLRGLFVYQPDYLPSGNRECCSFFYNFLERLVTQKLISKELVDEDAAQNMKLNFKGPIWKRYKIRYEENNA